ncbi:MAG: hypothetical protein KC431_25285, partial [Myxococcales bacterium]|nr:hypothetical protein [Myxococcales bacterium]
MMSRFAPRYALLSVFALSTACDLEDADAEPSMALDEDDEFRACTPPAYSIDPRKSLFETTVAVLTPFSMGSVMSAIDVNAGYPSTPMVTYNNIINNFEAGVPSDPGSRCDDFSDALGIGTGLNGYPLECERDERLQDFNMASWFPLAAVNRIDLMPADGSHCGEQRLILASNAGARMFLIFEAQIPNPDPGCIEACRPIAEFWESLSSKPIPARRTELQQAFLGTHPTLSAAGFGPFMSADNLTFGSGQIRSNNFDQPPWTLREHKLVDNGGVLVSVEVAVEGNIYGELWNDSSPWPQTPDCGIEIVNQLDPLLA